MRQTVFVTCFLVAAAALAKAPTTKIVVDGGGLKQSVEIVSPRVLEVSNVWFGHMFDETKPALATAPADATRFRLRFFANFGRGEENVYTLIYEPNPRGAGYLFLPKNDRNQGSILRKGRDGKWSYAAPDWENLIKPEILRAAR